MKTDLYTKILLTIIAVALSANVVKGFFITPVKADNRNFVSIPVNPDGTINVKIKNSETMDVKITAIDSRAFYYAEPLHVKVDQ
ncbi:MAG TPA: hypothetical protein VK668_00675 [Mucilaginibacter sp.]|nr:hypothetical protein [Mucilaginibacter sp.]